MNDSVSQGAMGRRPAPAGGYLWLVLSLIFGGVLAQSLISQGLPVLYPFIQGEFGLSRAQVGLITSAYAVGFGGAVLFSGWLADSIGVKRIITISLISLTAVTLLFPLASSFTVVLALAVLVGVVSSPLYPATSRAVMEWFPGRIRALAMSVKQAGFPIGGALTAALLPALALVMGWRLAAAVTGLLVLVIAVLFIALYHNAPRGAGTGRKLNIATMRAIFGNRPLVTTLVWTAVMSGLQHVVTTYFMLFLIEELHFSAVMAGGMLAVSQVTSSFFRVLWGAASDFIFHGRRVAVLAIMGFLTAAWMFGASLMGGGVAGGAVYALAIVIGISTISYPGVATTLIGEQSEPGQVGVTVGLGSLMQHANHVIQPPLFGLLVDMTGSYSLGWRVTAAVALACTLALVAFDREPKPGAG